MWVADARVIFTLDGGAGGIGCDGAMFCVKGGGSGGGDGRGLDCWIQGFFFKGVGFNIYIGAAILRRKEEGSES